MAKLTIRHQLDNWILQNYDITCISQSLNRKINCICNGTLKTLSVPIPVTHLLDMWQRKMNYLNKIYIQNLDKGIVVKGEPRVHNDLNILISKYDSYVSWKAKNIDDNSLRFYSIGVLLPISFREEFTKSVLFYAMYKLGYVTYDPSKSRYKWVPTTLALENNYLTILPNNKIVWTRKGIELARTLAIDIKKYVRRNEVEKNNDPEIANRNYRKATYTLKKDITNRVYHEEISF